MADWDWTPGGWSEGLEEPDYTELLDIKEKEEADEAAIRETLGVPDPDVLSPEAVQEAMEQRFAMMETDLSQQAPDPEVARLLDAGQVAPPEPDLAQQAPDPDVARALEAVEQPTPPLVAPGSALTVPRDFPTPEEEQEAKRAAELETELAKTPEQQIAERIQRDQEERDRQAEERRAVEDRYAEDLERDRSERKQVTIAARARFEEIAQAARLHGQQRIDNDNFWASRSTGQQIAGYLSAAISGWLKPGERNQTIALIERLIAQDIATQKANLGREGAAIKAQQGLYAQMYALSQDDLEATETATLAYHHSALNTMKALHSRYDPRGTTAQQAADQIREYEARTAQMEAQVEQRQFERRQAEAKDLRDEAKIEETNRAAIAREEEAEASRKSRAYQASQALKQAKEQARLGREHAITMEAKRAATEGAKEDIKAAKVEEKEIRELGVGGLVDPQTGKLHKFATPGDATNIRGLKTGLDVSVKLIDRMVYYRKEFKWMSDTVKSKEVRIIHQLFNQLVLNDKDVYQLGVLTGPDVDLLEGAIGTSDPTEWLDGVVAVLENGRKLSTEKFNTMLRNNQYTGAYYEPPVPQDIKVKREYETTAEKRMADAFEFGSTMPELAVEWQTFKDTHPGEGADPDGGFNDADQDSWLERQRKEHAKVIEAKARQPADWLLGK